MTDFRQLSQDVWASPQVSPAQVQIAAEQGFSLIINNRPDGEQDEQPSGEAIEAAAQAAGLDYCAIPITHAGFSQTQIAAMQEALGSANGRVLAYCRSGTRSTFLWALAQASDGADPDQLQGAAAEAGYDLSPLRPMLEALSSGSGG